MATNSNRLGEMLLEAGLIDQFQLESALSMQRNLGGQIGRALVKLGYLPEETVMQFLETQARVARVALRRIKIPHEVIRLIPAARMYELLVVPVDLNEQNGERSLRVAMTDPTNRKLIDDLRFATGCKILPLLATEEDIEEAINNNIPGDAPLFSDPPTPDQKTDSQAYGLVDLDRGAAEKFSFRREQDPRFDRLLDLLQQKGILNAIETERIRFG